LLTLAVALTSVTGQSCTWTKLANRNTPNGNITNITDFNTCQTQCEANLNSSCKYGFDWDNSSTALITLRCFFSTAPINTYESPNVDHYFCTLTSTIAQGGSGATTPVALYDNVCTYNESVNHNSPGGTAQKGANDLKSCKAACEANLVTCAFGFDFNPNAADDQKCWISTTSHIDSNPGVSHYTRNCTAVPATTTPYNMNSGAVPQSRSTFQGIQFLTFFFVFKFL
jgi:hypothetical protein